MDRLPDTSLYATAVLDDPDYAEWAAAQPEGPPRLPALTDWSLEVATLADIYDMLQAVHAAIVMSGGGKAGQLRPLPRPVTGVDRARRVMERRAYESLVDEVKHAQERWAQTKSGGGP